LNKASRNKQDDILNQMESVVRGNTAVAEKPTLSPEKKSPIVTQEKPQVNTDDSLSWMRKKPAKSKGTIVNCIVIDKDNHWNPDAKVDLKGMDTSSFTWGYYGTSYPVLLENKNGELEPFYLPDAAGESSNRLYKGANPEGFRATFRHKSSLLQKIQVGLMVALVLGLFFLMYVLVNN
jgi:hypothetical protein